MNLSINAIDSAIILAYLFAVLVLGLWIGRGQRDAADYFLGGRSLPWWALLLSIVATETSTVTFLSVPSMSWQTGHGDLRFLQITFGYIVGRMVVARVLLPLYFRGAPFTAYEVLQTRFGKATRRVASVLFLVTRNLSDALRLYLTALVLQAVLGLDMATCIVVLGIITILYTFVGGAKSVIWNDCVQFVIYMLGAAAAGVILIRSLPGGWDQWIQFAQDHHKLHLIDLDFSLTKPTMTFWAGLIGGMFLTMATHGTDQLMVQRYLAARKERDAALALVCSGLVVCFQFAIFLLLGVGLACFYTAYPPQTALTQGDKVFAHFIVQNMPTGLTGLTLAAVFAAAMSTLSSSLNSSASALVSDLYLPLRREELSPVAQLRVARLATILFGILQISIAMMSGRIGATESTVMSVLAIAGFATGPVLGLYWLAVFTHNVQQTSALIGFGIGLAVLSGLAYGTDLNSLWYAVVGSLTTLLAGWLVQKIVGIKV